MDRGTRVFWGLIIVLLGAALHFGLNAEQRRRAVQRSEATLATGDVVRLERVIDGDTVTVQTATGEAVAVRLLGIKAFDPTTQKGPAARFAGAAVASLKRTLQDEPIRVLLNDPPQDKHRRTLATLYVGDHDVGLSLVSAGLALVYTVYPFQGMNLYLQEQAAARAERRGLWANPVVAQRADLLMQQWRQEAQ